MFTTAARNSMITADGTTHYSVHTDYSATGTNEATGGSPAYARRPVTFAAAASGAKAPNANLLFDVPAGTYRFMGRWTALTGGTFLGMEPFGGNERTCSADLTTESIYCAAHGFTADQTIVFLGTPPGGLTEGVTYFVRTPATDTFQVAATAGGAAINLTSMPADSCVVSRIVPEVYGAQGQLTVVAATTSIGVTR